MGAVDVIEDTNVLASAVKVDGRHASVKTKTSQGQCQGQVLAVMDILSRGNDWLFKRTVSNGRAAGDVLRGRTTGK